MLLRVCVRCRRHVAVSESSCPFCAAQLAPARPQRITLVGRVSRAAVFSAALAACSQDKPKPAPAQGSDDLEKLLDDKPKVDHPDVAPPIDAADAVAPPIDAAIVDAGAPPDAGVVKKKKRMQKQQQQEQVKQIDIDRMQNAKPYGAPPARRRIV